MEITISINELEKRMRPGAYSVRGFLGLTESLEAVLRQDELTLQKLGVSYEKISADLEKVLSIALEEKHKLLYTNSPEYKERENYSVSLHKHPAPIFSFENPPSPNIGYVIDNKYQILFMQFRGFQECPWGCKDANGSFDFLLFNLQTGKYVTGPALIVHLIREHHFFEGIESPYRVDPFKLTQVIGLV